MYTEIFKLHSELLKAISHPKRLEVIHLLRNQRLSVSDMIDMLDLPQANLSQHLMVLRKAGVVETTRDGKQIYYQVAHKNFIKASDAVRDILIAKHKNTQIGASLELDMSDLVPLVHDPVCHMRVSPKTAGDTYKYQGNRYFFCASGCQKMFKENPQKYQVKAGDHHHE